MYNGDGLSDVEAYSDIRITEKDGAIGRIYLRDPRVDQVHLKI